MVDPMHFDARADVYDRVRPPYPEALWHRLEALGLLRAGLRVLDVGAGSGQATARFAAAGAAVTVLEPGPALAALLARRLPEVRVRVETAEAVDLLPGAFDVAVAATSVHWLDLAVVLPKLQRALVPGGHLAVWRNVFGDPAVSTPFRDRIEAIVRRRGGPDERAAAESDIDGWRGRLTAGGRFEVVDAGAWRWSVELDAAQVRDLFSTFSDWSEEEAREAGRAAANLGGRVTEHYRSWLLVLRSAEPGRPA